MSSIRLKRKPTGETRALFVQKIIELLERDRKASRETMCTELGLNPNACSMYLTYMRKELRLIRTTGTRNWLSAFEWELGEDPSLPAEGVPVQSTVKARQLGIKRDPLVAALFGMARIERGLSAGELAVAMGFSVEAAC